MQSEKFDKKAREAAENHHPAYDEHAWDKMEKLLDKHLPQKEEKKRRFIFIIFLFLLLGGSAWLFTARPWEQQDKPIAGTDQKAGNKPAPSPGRANDAVPVSQQEQETAVTTGTLPVQKQDQSGEPASGTTATKDISNISTENKKQENSYLPKIDAAGRVNNIAVNKRSTDRDQKNLRDPQQPAIQKNATNDKGDQPVQGKDGGTGKIKNQVVAAKDDPSNTKSPIPVATAEPARNKPADNTRPSIPGDEAKSKIPDTANVRVAAQPATGAKTDAPVAKADYKKKTKATNSKKNSLAFTLSAGPDISIVGDNKPGRTKLVTGLGLEYTIKERFSIRSGFYSARKIYSAKPEDYKAPPEFYQAYPYLEKVDANCRVFEIPISISYNFGKKSNEKWFVSAGISSFLMNEESYNYFYKYIPTGNTYTNEWTIKNENYHMFSVGTLSAGYKRNIGKRVTVMAEPYVKIPFSGVGYGKVKLNSGGALFTVGVKIF